jgi:trimeric autotransporter adhesin
VYLPFRTLLDARRFGLSRQPKQFSNGGKLQVKLRVRFAAVCLGLVAVCPSIAQVAASDSASTSIQVPRLIRFSGVAKDESGKPVSGLVGVTFYLYKDEQGGAPLWMEPQNVQADAAGHYTVLLGSATSDGVPLSLFSSAEAHWISTQISGQPEKPRVLLLSVPYALKAADAETLGGLPASAFVQTNQNAAAVNLATAKARTNASSKNANNATAPAAAIAGSGTTDFIPLWTSSTNLGNSILYQTGGNVGVATKTPGAKLDTAGTAIAVRGTSSGATGTGVFGKATNTTGVNFGVQGQTASTASGSAGVSGSNTATSGQVYGIFGSANSSTTNAIGVSGYEGATTGQVYGVNGNTSSTGPGAAAVNGYEGAATGLVYGVSGSTNSTTNYAAGVSGFEGANTGTVFGVQGGTNSTTNGAAGVSGNEGATTGQVNGVFGSTSSTTNFAAGVSGFENATTGQVFGVTGGTASTTQGAAAVNGYESATAGQVYGVNGGTNSSTNGAAGVNGFEGATSGQVYGVIGSTNSPNGSGVIGGNNATSGYAFGVQGFTASSTGIGVQGNNNATGAGASLAAGSTLINAFVGNSGKFNVDYSGDGFFAGNLNVTGKLTKGSGSFKIDHPLDPANKYLSHSFVESPDMMNVYNGNITTDNHGLATVMLPDYFEALNRDFRYQLTVIGQFAQAVVKQEIANNRFTIKTSKPSVKVSWQVTGIRHDAYADAYRIPVEEDKSPQEQGHYLHPELFGASERQAIGAGMPVPSAASGPPTRASLP